MPISFSIDPHHRVAIIEVHGSLGPADIADVAVRLRKAPFFHPSFSLLVDLSQAGEMNFDFARMDDTVHSGQDPFHPDSRRAIVATRPETYGIARMYQALKGFTVAVFPNREEAMEWLARAPIGKP
jgi:hypothetical protein